MTQRFLRRVQSKERHPGHVDEEVTEDQFKKMLSGQKYRKLDIGGVNISFVTDDFTVCDYDGLINKVKSIVNQSS